MLQYYSVFSKDVWNDNRKGVSCWWQICFEITICCHSWTSVQKKGKIQQIPLRQGGVHKAKKRQDLYVLSWKSSYDVMLFTCQNCQHFVEFWFVWLLGPGICKNTICYSGSSQRMWVYISCLFSISPEPISNTRMFIYFVYCILIIVYLLQGSVMEQPLIKYRPRLSMT